MPLADGPDPTNLPASHLAQSKVVNACTASSVEGMDGGHLLSLLQGAYAKMCDIRLEGADAHVRGMAGGLDGVYKVSTCEGGRPAFLRQHSPLWRSLPPPPPLFLFPYRMGPVNWTQFLLQKPGLLCAGPHGCDGSSSRPRCSVSACPAEERLLWFSTVHKDWDFSNGSTANPVCTPPPPPLLLTPPSIHSIFTKGQAVPQVFSQAVWAQGLTSRRHLDAMLSTSASATPASESLAASHWFRESPMLGCTFTGWYGGVGLLFRSGRVDGEEE